MKIISDYKELRDQTFDTVEACQEAEAAIDAQKAKEAEAQNQRRIEELEEMLSRFPQDFFRKLYGQTTICIVRSITGSAASGSLEQAKGIQFWDGEQAYVVLAAGESLQQSFCHEIFHVIDSKVLSTTRVYYHWENLNPQGCKYFEDFTSWQTADVSQYLEGENRAFIDAYSMTYPKEDRARIMEYAMLDGQQALFQSDPAHMCSPAVLQDLS